MKRLNILFVLLIMLVALCGCSCKKEDSGLTYTHYLRGGGSETLDADILWEYSNKTYTKYQVAYTSYVCSDPSVNYINVIYIEITNKGSKEEALIRNISFSTITENEVEFNVGLWGDYKEAIKKEYYTGIETELLTKLKYAKYDFVSQVAENGYGNYKSIEGINSDLITGGTISASNVVSIVKAIFDYHLENYY